MPLMRLPGSDTRRTLALLGGFCFFLSALEFMIPKPLPFIRLGLANLPLLLALDIMPFSSFLLLAALKITGQALISGTLFSYVFLFSLGGTGVSALLMYALHRGAGKERISLIGISAAGALASNGVQLVLAYFFVFGAGIRYAAAPILAFGLITGTLLGIAGEYFIRRSLWYQRNLDPVNARLSRNSTENLHEPETDDVIRTAHPGPLTASSWKNKLGMNAWAREAFCLGAFNSNELALAGLCMAPALLLNPDTAMRVIQFLFFWALAWLSGKKNNALITFSVIAGIVFFNLLVPFGEILFSIGPLRITSGALESGIRRAVTLEGLFMLSRCCVRRDLALPGAFGEIMGESFRFFSRLGGERNLINPKNWIRDLDGLLISCAEGSMKAGKGETMPSPSQPSGRTPGQKTTGPWIILVTVMILAWLPLAIKALLRL